MNEMPSKPFGISHSKLATYRRCRQQYHWKYVDKLFTPSSIGQMRGTAGHVAVASWHQFYDADKAMQAAWDNWQNAGLGEGSEWDMLEQALSRYFVWSVETARDNFVLEIAEQEFNVEYEVLVPVMSLTPGLETVQVKLTGFIDGVVDEKGKKWLVEHKFYKRMDNSTQEMDPQVSMYMLAAHLLGIEAVGVIYNKVRVGDSKVAEKEPAVRQRVFRNPQGLDHFQKEILLQATEMIQYERGGGVPYRNMTKDCSWDCAFHAACLSLTDDGQDPRDILLQIVNKRSNDG